jgi:hypothetical protein
MIYFRWLNLAHVLVYRQANNQVLRPSVTRAGGLNLLEWEALTSCSCTGKPTTRY